MTTLQIRKNLKKIIDTADEETIKRIQNYIEEDSDCVDFLSEDQLSLLDNAIKDADKGLGMPHDDVMKEIKKKWLVK